MDHDYHEGALEAWDRLQRAGFEPRAYQPEGQLCRFYLDRNPDGFMGVGNHLAAAMVDCLGQYLSSLFPRRG